MFKFNSGNGAIICDKCGRIMYSNVTPGDYDDLTRLGFIDICDLCKYDLSSQSESESLRSYRVQSYEP